MLQRFASKQCQPLYISGTQGIQQTVFRLFRKRLSVMKIPRLLIKTVLTSVGAAADEQSYPDSRAIGNITGFDFRIMHDCSLLFKNAENKPVFRAIFS